LPEEAQQRSWVMSRYYFDMRDEQGVSPDEEGVECRDLDAVQDEAARSLLEMARDAVYRQSRVPCREMSMSIEVRDDVGPVMIARFAFEVLRRR